MNIDQLNKRYALALAKLELAQHTGALRTSENVKLVNYFTSTTNRRAFGIKCVVCAINCNDCTPSNIAKELGVSMNALDTMINECEDAGWITVKRNKHNYRRVRAAKVLVDEWVSYSKKVADFSATQNFIAIQAARKLHQMDCVP